MTMTNGTTIATSTAMPTVDPLKATSTTEKDMETTPAKDDEDEEEITCPLFMEEGLPSDFASNPHLAAIASLLEEDEEDGKKKDRKPSPLLMPVGPAAGGAPATTTP
jgi:hypothetical protein